MRCIPLLLVALALAAGASVAAAAAASQPAPAACVRAWNAHSPYKGVVLRRGTTGALVHSAEAFSVPASGTESVCEFSFFRPSPYMVVAVWSGGRVTRWRPPRPVVHIGAGSALPSGGTNARVVERGRLRLR